MLPSSTQKLTRHLAIFNCIKNRVIFTVSRKAPNVGMVLVFCNYDTDLHMQIKVKSWFYTPVIVFIYRGLHFNWNMIFNCLHLLLFDSMVYNSASKVHISSLSFSNVKWPSCSNRVCCRLWLFRLWLLLGQLDLEFYCCRFPIVIDSLLVDPSAH